MSRYGMGMSMTVKIILIVSLFLIGSHLLLWGFIKRKLREAEARIAKEKAQGGDGGYDSVGVDASSDYGGGSCD